MTNLANGLQVLVTRPEPQATELVSLITEQGGNALAWPCLEIKAVDPKIIQTEIQKLTPETLAIFVSPNAVKYALGCYKGPVPNTLIAVGQGTAKALAKFGLTQVHYPKQANSEAVLDLPILHNVENKPIAIFRAQSGRELIADSLKQRGAIVSYIEVYQRLKLKKNPSELSTRWRQSPFDWVISTSTEGLESLFEQIQDLPQDYINKTVVTVMNEKMLHLATQRGFRTFFIQSADNASIISYLMRFWHER